MCVCVCMYKILYSGKVDSIFYGLFLLSRNYLQSIA